jgi:hypothetical protein
VWSHQALIKLLQRSIRQRLRTNYEWTRPAGPPPRSHQAAASCGTSLAGAGQLASLHRDNYHRATQSWRLFLASSHPHLLLHDPIDPSPGAHLGAIQLGQRLRRSRGCARIPRSLRASLRFFFTYEVRVGYLGIFLSPETIVKVEGFAFFTCPLNLVQIGQAKKSYNPI